MYMPDLNEDKLPNREFVLNVGNIWATKNEFSQYFNSKLSPKHDRKMLMKKEKKVIFRSAASKWRFCQNLEECLKKLKKYHVFHIKSNHSIGNNGRFYQLVRNTKKRRKSKLIKKEIDKKNEEIKLEISMRDKAIKELQRIVQKFDQLELENDKNSKILSRLYDSGVIDENGALVRNFVKPEDMK